MVDREQVQRFAAALDSLGQMESGSDAGIGAVPQAAPMNALNIDSDAALPKFGRGLRNSFQAFKQR